MWQYHCQRVSKVRSITSDKKEHLILIHVQPTKKTRILNLNVPNNITWRRQWQASLVLLPRKSHRQRSLVGCSPWGR